MIQNKYKKWCLIPLIGLFIALGIVPAQSGATCPLKESVQTQDGVLSQSTNYKIVNTIQQPLSVNAVSSTNYIISSQFWGGMKSLKTSADQICDEVLPKEFKLCQNYPNPFNPETTIKFHLPRSSKVTLTIYDVQGHLVRQLVRGTRAPGYHSVQWNGQNEAGMMVTTGVYFYRIQADNYCEIKRCLLLK